METFTKENEFEVAITAEVKAPEVIIKDLKQLEDDLAQAIASREYIVERQADELAPIDATIALFQKRVDEAKKLNISAKVVVEEVLEEII